MGFAGLCLVLLIGDISGWASVRSLHCWWGLVLNDELLCLAVVGLEEVNAVIEVGNVYFGIVIIGFEC